MPNNILITGLPKSGKTTLLKKILDEKRGNKVGFLTTELRENGKRVGFEIETHNGKKALLASKKMKSQYRVSSYSVDIANLEAIFPEVADFGKNDILYLDEIGQMELFSEKFKDLVLKYLEADNITLITITKVYEDKFTSMIKNRQDVSLYEINVKNRNNLTKTIKAKIKSLTSS